jgi:ornithine cyclodeaminase/alanine dehydrogenase-like protein (mu-crystallin family)
MTLMINAQQVVDVLSMRDCIDAMEEAFAEEAREIAVNHPRQRYRVPRTPDPGQPGYFANMIAGAVPSRGVAALRYDSVLVRESIVDGVKRRDYVHPSGRSYGFVILFSLETAEPLAILQDFTLSPIRVGATTAVAVRRLARRDAVSVGLFGAGNEARRNLEAICLVRPIERVLVFSPSEEHREAFAKEMSAQLGVSVRPAGAPRPVVEGADIVMCATNSSQPVFDGRWLVPGQTVVTIGNSDAVSRKSEADEATFLRSDLIVLNSRETAVSNQQGELLDLIDAGKFGWDKVAELGGILTGKQPGRTSGEQIIYYKSNAGVGIQFAAAGALVYDECKRRGIGHEVPTEWFGTDVSEWLAKGFRPSP